MGGPRALEYSYAHTEAFLHRAAGESSAAFAAEGEDAGSEGGLKGRDYPSTVALCRLHTLELLCSGLNDHAAAASFLESATATRLLQASRYADCIMQYVRHWREWVLHFTGEACLPLKRFEPVAGPSHFTKMAEGADGAQKHPFFACS